MRQPLLPHFQMVTVLVEVTSQDLANGNARRCYSCPLALAFNRVLVPGWRSEVTPYGINILAAHTGTVHRFPTSERMREFILGLDAESVHIRPAEFRFDLPGNIVNDNATIINPAAAEGGAIMERAS